MFIEVVIHYNSNKQSKSNRWTLWNVLSNRNYLYKTAGIYAKSVSVANISVLHETGHFIDNYLGHKEGIGMNKKEVKELIIKTLIVSITIATVVLISYSLLNIVNIVEFIISIINILMPFIIGCIIAYLLTPMCTKLYRIMTRHSKISHKVANVVSIIFVEIVTFYLIGVCALIILPQLIDSGITIIEKLPSTLNNLERMIADNKQASDMILTILGMDITTEVLNLQETIIETITNYMLPNLDKLVGQITSSITSLTSTVLDIILGIIVSIFVLLNREQFGKQSKRFSLAIFGERITRYIEEELIIANKMFSGFFIGKLVDSTIIGILCFIGLTILNMPYSILISVIVGITNIIPIFGPFIGAVPGFIIIFAENPLQSLWFLIFIVALQQLDGNVIGPKCIGDATGLNTFWVLLAIILFGGLWGIIGMLIGVPLMAVLHDIAEKVINHILYKRGITSDLEEKNE